MASWIEETAACEDELRAHAAAGRLQELEAPLRRMQALLDAAPPEEAAGPYAPYFRMLFEQVNAGLYQNAGQPQPMQRHFLAGQQAAEQLAARLPLDAAPQQAPEAARIMALNAANFTRTAGLALEAADPDAAWALTGLTARLLDWLWPVLEEEQAVIAAEAHVKLASLAAAFRGDADESARQLEAAREKFRDLGARTGNGEYLRRVESVSLGAGGAGELTPEMLAANPALAQVARVARFNEQGFAAAQNGETEQAAFYFEKGVAQAGEMLKTVRLPDALRIAALAYLGAATCAEDAAPDKARRYAAQGLALCGQMEADPACMPPKELAALRKEFERLARERKPGLFGRLFGH